MYNLCCIIWRRRRRRNTRLSVRWMMESHVPFTRPIRRLIVAC